MNSELFSHYVLIFLTALLVTLVVVPVSLWFSRKINLIDFPGSMPHHNHFRPTPLTGGMILVLAFIICASIFNLWKIPGVITASLAGLVIFGFGIWDDLKGLNAPKKLLGQVIATTILVISGVRVQFLESPQIATVGPLALYTFLDIAITYLWVVGVTNAFNLIDSMDGIAAGLSITALASYAIGTSLSGQPDITLICVVLAGIATILLVLNSAPARIFLGDSGSQTLGFIMATISIAFVPQGFYQASSWFFPILIVSVPIFDTFLVIYSRLKEGQPVFAANLDHIYHRLTRIGFSSSRSVIIINTAALILACIGFVAITQRPLAANLIFGACLIVGVIGIILLGNNTLIRSINLKVKEYLARHEPDEEL